MKKKLALTGDVLEDCVLIFQTVVEQHVLIPPLPCCIITLIRLFLTWFHFNIRRLCALLEHITFRIDCQGLEMMVQNNKGAGSIKTKTSNLANIYSLNNFL